MTECGLDEGKKVMEKQKKKKRQSRAKHSLKFQKCVRQMCSLGAVYCAVCCERYARYAMTSFDDDDDDHMFSRCLWRAYDGNVMSSAFVVHTTH